MQVPILRDVLFAYVADESTASAFQLVTTVFFDYRQATLRTFADQSCSHCFLDGVAYFKTTFLFRFLTSLRNMGFFLAKAAADFLAVRVQASKFFVLFNRRTNCFEITEWTLFKAIDARLCNFVLLLQVLQPLHQLVTDYFPDQFATELGLTSTSIKAFQFVLHRANLYLGFLLDTGVAKQMSLVSVTRHGTVWKHFGKTTLTFNQSSSYSVLFLNKFLDRVIVSLLECT